MTGMHEVDYAARLDALAETWQVWADVGGGLKERDWVRPTRCPGWDVRALYAHHAGFPVALSAPPPVPDGPSVDPVSAAEVLRRFNAPGGVATSMAQAVADGAVAEAARCSSAELVDRFRVLALRAIAGLRGAPATTVVPWSAAGATLPLVEAVRIIVMEATVHLLDLHRALDQPPAVPPAALRTTVHLLAEVAPDVDFIEAATGRSTTSPLPVVR